MSHSDTLYLDYKYVLTVTYNHSPLADTPKFRWEIFEGDAHQFEIDKLNKNVLISRQRFFKFP